MNKIIIIFGSLFLSSCSGLMADNYFKVIEYAADSGGVVPGVAGMAGGCLISTKGTPPEDANVTYNGVKCKVVIGDLIDEVQSAVQVPTELRLIPNE